MLLDLKTLYQIMSIEVLYIFKQTEYRFAGALLVNSQDTLIVIKREIIGRSVILFLTNYSAENTKRVGRNATIMSFAVYVKYFQLIMINPDISIICSVPGFLKIFL